MIRRMMRRTTNLSGEHFIHLDLLHAGLDGNFLEGDEDGGGRFALLDEAANGDLVLALGNGLGLLLVEVRGREGTLRDGREDASGQLTLLLGERVD